MPPKSKMAANDQKYTKIHDAYYSSWKNIHHSIFSAKILAQRFCHFEFWLQFWLHFYFSAKILSHPSTINAESLPILFWLPVSFWPKLGQKSQNGQFLVKSTFISGNTAKIWATSGSCIRCYQNVHLAPNILEFWHFLKIFG